MDLFTFIVHPDPTTLGSVFCFITKQNSLLITNIFKKKFELQALQLTMLSLHDSQAIIKAQLEMSFLGTRSIFWIPEELVAENPDLLTYLRAYSGPHIIGYTCQQASSSNDKQVIIDVPQELNYEQFIACFTMLYPTSWKKGIGCAQQIFKMTATLSAHSVLMLMHYCMLIGSKSDVFIQEWLPTLLNPEKSLFTLSSLLFAKKEQQFFQLWSLLAQDYSEPFWTTYWSEQFFRAALFVSLMQSGKIVQAKKIAYRLPFSFVQKDWKISSVDSLKRTHNHLYTIDWNIKNGLPAHFDYFYAQFMVSKK